MNLIAYFQSNWHTISQALLVHMQISFLSLLFAVLLAVPLGILLVQHEKAAKIVLAIAGVIQTIPGLVMLGIGLLLFGLGVLPAIIVLVAYALLPILQNTYTGIKKVEGIYTEAARGIGMTKFQVLVKVEFPLASPTIVSGIRLSLVYIISWATLAALIGAGGLGDLIWTGLSCYDTNMILSGAILASLLAIVSGLLIDLLQKALTPRGIQLRKEGK